MGKWQDAVDSGAYLVHRMGTTLWTVNFFLLQTASDLRRRYPPGVDRNYFSDPSVHRCAVDNSPCDGPSGPVRLVCPRRHMSGRDRPGAWQAGRAHMNAGALLDPLTLPEKSLLGMSSGGYARGGMAEIAARARHRAAREGRDGGTQRESPRRWRGLPRGSGPATDASQRRQLAGD